jgi:starch phosphorylase
MFIFGALVNEVEGLRADMRSGKRDYVGSRLKRVFDTIRSNHFGEMKGVNDILSSLEGGHDHYLVCADFYPYLIAQEKVEETYRDYRKWTQMAIEGLAYSGKFSSDRTIQEYCTDIWKIDPVSVPKPSGNPEARVRSFANLTEAVKDEL